jgi:hypothetical protein
VIVATRTSLPSDRSFESYEAALANITTAPKLVSGTEIFWDQGMLDVLFEYRLTRISLTLRSAGTDAARLQVNIVLRFLQPGKASEPSTCTPTPASCTSIRAGTRRFTVRARRLLPHPRRHRPPAVPVCLVIPFRKFRPLAIVITAVHRRAFGDAHLRPRTAWRRTAVVPAADRNAHRRLNPLHGLREHRRPKLQRRWIVTFGFGLIHGFGFSFLLRQRLQFAGEHLVTSLLAFNVGVEIGQLFVLLVTIPALVLLFRTWSPSAWAPSCCRRSSAHTAWHWAIDRGTTLRDTDSQSSRCRTWRPGFGC